MLVAADLATAVDIEIKALEEEVTALPAPAPTILLLPDPTTAADRSADGSEDHMDNFDYNYDSVNGGGSV